jgi:glucose-6-phosphate isomerase
MSVLRPKPPEDPLSLDLGSTAEAVFEQLQLMPRNPRQAAAGDAGPDRLLDAYMTNRPASELFRVLAVAREIREAVDGVAVVSDGPLGHLINGLFSACCHPFHNDLSRGERGGKPRLFFDLIPVDADRTAGLLDLLAAARGDDLLDRWAVVHITGDSMSPLLSERSTRYQTFCKPGASDPGGWQSPQTPPINLELKTPHAGLAAAFSLPVLTLASVAGIDVVHLLKGGVAMLRRFQEAPPESNPPFLLAALTRAVGLSQPPCMLSLDARGVPAARLLADWWSLEDAVDGRGTFTAERRCRLRVGKPRREWLPPSTRPLFTETKEGLSTANPFQPGPSMHAVEIAAPRHTAGETAEDSARCCGRGDALSAAEMDPVVCLPRLDEHSIGQLLSLRMLATEVLSWGAARSTG